MRPSRLIALGVFFACFVAGVAGLAASPYWLDSSEFATAAFELGVAHPPGHPLAQLVFKLFALLPFGPVAFRVGLASTMLSSVAAALTTLVALDVARRMGEALGARMVRLEQLAGASAGLVFGLGHAAYMQAVRPEVYALNAALTMGAALLLLGFDEASASERADGRSPRRHLYTAALVLGCALANHHFLAGLFCIAAFAFLLARRLRGMTVRGALIVVGAGLLGLLLYAYLPIRAGRHPVANWGVPTNASRFVWTVSARAFQKSLGHAAEGGFGDAAMAMLLECGLLAPLALIGAYLSLRMQRTRALGVLVVLGIALVGFAPAMVGFDPANPDAYGYLEPAVALACALGAGVPGAIASLFTRASLRRAVTVWIGALLVAAPLVSARDIGSLSLARFRDTDAFSRALLDEAPPRAALFTSYFQTVFAIWYARVVEGTRPDVDHLHRHFLPNPGYRDEEVLRRPDLAPLLGPLDVDAGALLDASRRRPIQLEYDIDLPPSLTAGLVPSGLTARLSPLDEPPPPDEDAALARADRRQADLAARLDPREPQSRRLLLWLDFLAIDLACRQQHHAAASAALARARALVAPSVDAELENLAARCHLR